MARSQQDLCNLGKILVNCLYFVAHFVGCWSAVLVYHVGVTRPKISSFSFSCGGLKAAAHFVFDYFAVGFL